MRLIDTMKANTENKVFSKYINLIFLSLGLLSLSACNPKSEAPRLDNAPAQAYTQNVVISVLSFNNAGGEKLTNCSADSLPTGLSVAKTADSKTCEITGTPTAVQAVTTHTITATNATGSDTATVSMEVKAPVPPLALPALDNAADQVYTKDAVIATLVFSNLGGGELINCSVDSLPSGLNVTKSADSKTCEITGTPTAIQAVTTHTITATNVTGSDTATVSIEVKAVIPPLASPILGNATAQGYTKGTAIIVLSFTNNGGGSLSSCIADTLPTGLSVGVSTNSSTCEITGTPTIVQTATNHTITATNATGSDTATVSIEVIGSSPNMIELVKDIDPISTIGSYPKRLTKVGNTLYFLTNSPGNNITKLWKSDGTEATTILLKTFSVNLTAHTRLVAVGNTLFFNIKDGTHGLELWKSNGTPETTMLVKDIYAGSAGSVTELTVFGSEVFFAGFSAESGTELWKSDGTSAGTLMVKNINPDVQGQIKSSDPSHLTVMGNTLYFAASDDSFDSNTGRIRYRGIWKSKGTGITTVSVKDSHIFNAKIKNLTVVGGTLFFSAPYDTSSFNHGNELWKTDGTPAGTMIVKDINTVPNSNFENGSAFQFHTKSYFIAVGDTLYFVAFNGAISNGGNGWELWKSDGTANGTVLVKDIVTTGFGSSNPENLIAIGNTLYFVVADVTHGLELWKSDGTENGTVLLKDTLPGSGDGFYRGLGYLTVVGNKFYFSALGFLWVSDGTTVGTVKVSESGLQEYRELTLIGNILYFSAKDILHGQELWKLNTQ